MALVILLQLVSDSIIHDPVQVSVGIWIKWILDQLIY